MTSQKITIKGWQRVLLLIIPYIFIVGFFSFIGMLIAGVPYMDTNYVESSEQRVLTSGFDLAGTFFLLWIFMKFVDKEKFINLGFGIKNRFKEFNYGIAIGALIMIVGYLIILALGEIHFEKIIFDLKEIILAILLYSIVAIVEEVLFRGYILKNLMLSFNKYTALVISSLLFALMHAGNPNFDFFSFIDLFLAGILLGISCTFTKNLWFPIALHFSWNFFQSLLGFNVSGQDFYSLIGFKRIENNLINGGDFGFEGSILSLIFQVLFIILIWYYYTRKSINLINYNYEIKSI